MPLRGNVSLMARPEFDQGAAPAATQMTGMHLLLSRSKEQEAALDRYMAEQLDRSSPNYHKWLTPDQLGKLYGPAKSDVDAVAADGMDNSTWLVCTDDTDSSGYTEDCSTQSNGKSYFAGVGGTSASGPAFAGMLALVQQAVGGRLGLDAVKTLYDLSNGSNSSSVFHDVNVGNISVFCYDAETDCTRNSDGYYFMDGYNTNTGYDCWFYANLSSRLAPQL